MKTTTLVVLSASLLALAGCSKVNPVSADANANPTVNAAPAAGPANAAEPAEPDSLTLPAGTSFRVRLRETLDTRRNRAGDRFAALLDEPLVDRDRVVIPKGTDFWGHITESKASGRFKGRALLALRLDSFSLNGHNYEIRSTSSSHVSKGHKKHHLAWIGGSSGGGALIGAAAGGGVGALVGAGAGAAAGTVGSAVTGKRNVTLPVETPLTFRFQSAVSVG
jgi:outer membrane lipoprotein SlyB